jgi:hypothetical protein
MTMSRDAAARSKQTGRLHVVPTNVERCQIQVRKLFATQPVTPWLENATLTQT